MAERKVVAGAGFDMLHGNRRGPVRFAAMWHVDAVPHSEIPFAAGGPLGTAAERAVVRRMFDHAFAPDRGVQHFDTRDRAMLRIDYLQVGDAVEVEAVIDRTRFQAVVVTRDHHDRQRLFGENIHRPGDRLLTGRVRIEQITRDQKQVRRMTAHLDERAREAVLVVVAAGAVQAGGVAIQVDVGTMGKAKAVGHGQCFVGKKPNAARFSRGCL